MHINQFHCNVNDSLLFFQLLWYLELFYIVVCSVVSMTADLHSCCLTEQQLCGDIDVNPLSHSRDRNLHNTREHGELRPFTCCFGIEYLCFY